MTLPIRRALALFFICLFALVAPAALAYARGYRFNFTTRDFKQTGVILLHGQPKNVTVSIDGQAPRSVTLPRTYRSIAPGLHTLHIAAAGYSNQVIAANVQPGQTIYLPAIQLIYQAPLHVIRSGLPSNALLAPGGSAVAWVTDGRVVVAGLKTTVKSSVIDNLASITWYADQIECFDQKKKFLGSVSLSGTFTIGGTSKVTVDLQLKKLAATADLHYGQAQRIPTLDAWLLTNPEGAWLLDAKGEKSIVSRWAEEPIGARIIGQSILVIARPTGLTIRNLGNNQNETFTQPGILAIAEIPNNGSLDLLVQDSDLRTWMRSTFF